MFWNRKPKDKPEDPTAEEDDMPEYEKPAPLQMPDTSKQREFLVGHSFNKKTGTIESFFVIDCFDDAELQAGTRPAVATFKVSQLYDAHEQKLRAEKYCEYMNRINEAKQKAYEQTLLIDMLKDDV